MTKWTFALLVLCNAISGSAQAATIGTSAKQFGNLASDSYASRVITLGKETNQITVASGETMTLHAGGQSVSWTFFESIEPQFLNLSAPFPNLEGAENVWMYIQPSEVYRAG
ncbi:exported protein of unknown function (plasmid) [Cupriavidus taiwanensis]|uniref:Uncharacterized protein n=1 Tax=Cupriavidus taiwanensis TaxID=164546 RepID=A0A375IMV4_9BURK|nr:CzcE family metal-binding protein [Cupriavidus taiwanensis]SPK76023.1 exported protein of unknown function [Cupriavidus taiwanensis]